MSEIGHLAASKPSTSTSTHTSSIRVRRVQSAVQQPAIPIVLRRPSNVIACASRASIRRVISRSKCSHICFECGRIYSDIVAYCVHHIHNTGELRRELLINEYTTFIMGRGSITGTLLAPAIVTVSFYVSHPSAVG